MEFGLPEAPAFNLLSAILSEWNGRAVGMWRNCRLSH
jgi:hypothetical protein